MVWTQITSSSWCKVCFGAVMVTDMMRGSAGQVFLASPRARQVVTFGGFLSPLRIADLNGGGAEFERINKHGVCGGQNLAPDIRHPSNHFLEDGVWAPTEPQATYTAGDTIEIQVAVAENKFGWFEFRLCVPEEEGDPGFLTTQDCLNKHVLKFDANFTRNQFVSEMRLGHSSPSDLAGGAGLDPFLCNGDTINPNAPSGSCCSNGGNCEQISLNSERWVLPDHQNTDGPNGETLFTMRYILPSDVECSRCTLQMFYSQGEGIDLGDGFSYPSGVWNCADITINNLDNRRPIDVIVGISASFGALFIIGVALSIWYSRGTSFQSLKRMNGGTSEVELIIGRPTAVQHKGGGGIGSKMGSHFGSSGHMPYIEPAQSPARTFKNPAASPGFKFGGSGGGGGGFKPTRKPNVMQRPPPPPSNFGRDSLDV